MTVRFVLGRAGSGKTYYCLSEMARLLKEPSAGPVLFILPEQATFIHERMLACQFTPHGYMGGEVTSFKRLIWQAAARAGEAVKPPLSEAARALLMGRLLTARRGELRMFGAAGLAGGFARDMSALAEELLAYNVEPALLLELADRRRATLPADPLADKLADIALLAGDYAAAIADYDNFPDGLSFLTRQIMENGFLAGATVFVDGYAAFSPRERAVLAALMQKAARVEIALALDPQELLRDLSEQDIFYPCWKSYGLLAEAARRAGVAVEEPKRLDGGQGRFAANAELAFLERHCYPWSDAAARQEQPRSIRLLAAANPREELRQAGLEIQRLVRAGLRYREISVIARETAPYEDLLPAVFGDLDIPYFVDAKKPLLYHPLVELTRSALEIWAGEASYRHIFRYLKTALTPLEPEETDVLENYCLAHGIRHWQWRKDVDFKYWRGRETAEQAAEELARLNEYKRRGTAALACFLEAAPPPGATVEAAALLTALFALLDDLQVQRTLADWQEQALAAGRGEEAAAHRQAVAKLTGFLSEAQALLGGWQFSAQQLLSLLDTGCAGLTLSLIPPGQDQVLVASLERSRNPELKAAIIIGVNADMLPKKIQPQALLSDYERAALHSAGLELAPDTRSRQLNEHFLAYIALTRSGGQLLLSYALNGGDGALLPSPLLKRVQKLFPALKAERCRVPLPPAASQSAPAQTLLAAPTLTRLYGSTLKSSVSRLEKFRACPFAYFAAYGLRLKARPVYEITPLERGDIFHQALAELGRMLAARGQEWQELDEANAASLVDEVLAGLMPRFLSGILTESARHRYLAGRIRDTLIATVMALAEHMRRGEFVPVAWELPFGSRAGDALPALIIDLGGGKKLEIRGQIDRVDMARGADKAWFRVIDYKTGQVSLRVEDIMEGLRLQLLVYLQVVLDNGAYFAAADEPSASGQPPEPAAAGMYYMPVRDDYTDGPMPPSDGAEAMAGLKLSGLTVKDEEAVKLADPDIKGHSKLIPAAFSAKKGFWANSPGLDAEQLAELRQHLPRLLRETAGQMMSGLVAISPRRAANFDACAWCEYRHVCGFDREVAR